MKSLFAASETPEVKRSEPGEIWLRVAEALPWIGCSKKTFHANRIAGRYTTRETTGRGGIQYEVRLEGAALIQYCEVNMPEIKAPADHTAECANIESEVTALDSMQPYQREYALVWKSILADTDGMTVKEIETYALSYKLAHPEFAISSGSIYRNRQKYRKAGIRGLCPGWGATRGESAIADEWLDHYVSVFFREAGPGADACRLETLGFVTMIDPSIDASTFPSSASFIRRVKSKYPQPYIDYRRKGKRYYQRNYEYYIKRDWSGIDAGQGWVSDHHQLDVMCLDSTGHTVRPWVTAWMDLRSGKMLCAYVHAESPTSDHVMMSFAWAVEKFGLPDFIYLDNGKDYRSIDFSGNYKRHKVWNESTEEYARSVIGMFDVKVVFAREYNAQAKTIERQFRVVIALYCKFMVGYTGSNVVEKPETLNAEVRRGELMSLEDCIKITNHYFETVFNRRTSDGDLLRGMCPDQAWEKYRGRIRMISKDSLKYCCMRSKECRIGRDGIIDNSLGIELRYWSDKFYTLRNTKVFVRRDIREYNIAWVFRASDNAFICTAELYTRAAGYAQTTLEKDELKKQIERKNRDLKRARDATRTITRPSAHEIIRNIEAGIAATSSWKPASTDSPAPDTLMQVTAMDHAAAQVQADAKRGRFDPTEFAPDKGSSEDTSEIDIWGISKAS